MKEQTTYIIDFDSTFVQKETLEVIAEISLKHNPKKEAILQEIKRITNLGMEGIISFSESLQKRLQLVSPTKKDVRESIHYLQQHTTPSVKRNKSFFKKNAHNIYIISGGFKECIIPVVKPYGISPSHILANTLLFDKKGVCIGCDKTNPLAQDKGKIKAISLVHLGGRKTIVIGDGYTDYEIKKAGLAHEFIAFTENVKREAVIKHAKRIIASFDELVHPLSYPKSKIKALLVENIHEDAVALLEKEGYEVEFHEKALADHVLREKIKSIHLLGIRSRTIITPQLLQSTHRLLGIGAYCIGTNQIEIKHAAKNGICVFNSPFSNTRSVVELIIGEIIMLSRGILPKNNNLHRGIWDKTALGSNEIRGMRLGIVGYGHIGSQLSVLAESLGMEVYFFNTSEVLNLGNAKKCSSLKELLKIADIVTVHVDGRPENNNLIAEKEFALMKPGVIFLNASRGFVVDIDALAFNIKSGKIKGAAIDVFPKEPHGKDEVFSSPLQGLPNVILSPHVGGSTIEAQKDIAHFVTKKLIDYVNTGSTELSVNMPCLTPPPVQKHTHRLLHIHHNVPGILAAINSILSRHKANIESQYLKTNEDIGYVITDINKTYDDAMLQELKQIPNTIKYRILY